MLDNNNPVRATRSDALETYPNAKTYRELYRPTQQMPEKLGRIRLLYIVLGVLLLVGLLPLASEQVELSPVHSAHATERAAVRKRRGEGA